MKLGIERRKLKSSLTLGTATCRSTHICSDSWFDVSFNLLRSFDRLQIYIVVLRSEPIR